MTDEDPEGTWLNVSADEFLHDISILTRNKLLGSSDVAVSPSAFQAFTSQLVASGATYSSLVNNLGR